THVAGHCAQTREAIPRTLKEQQITKLPLAVAGITAKWLTEALSIRHPQVEVTRAEIVDVDHGTSTRIRVRVAYNRSGEDAALPPTLIVKGAFEAHSAPMQAMYEREARFYRDVQPFVP